MLVLLAGASARPDEWHCPTIVGGNAALAALDPGRRILYVQRRLDEDARRVRILAWSFAALYTGLTVGNGARLRVVHTHGDKVDQVFATAASAFGLVVLAIMPPAVLRDHTRLTRIVRSYESSDDRCGVLAAAERILLRDAKSEAFGRGPMVHVGNFAFNAAIGILLLTVWHHSATAQLVAPVAIAGGELQQGLLWTHTNDALETYRSGHLDDRSPTHAPLSWSLVPRLGHGHVGAVWGFSI